MLAAQFDPNKLRGGGESDGIRTNFVGNCSQKDKANPLSSLRE